MISSGKSGSQLLTRANRRKAPTASQKPELSLSRDDSKKPAEPTHGRDKASHGILAHRRWKLWSGMIFFWVFLLGFYARYYLPASLGIGSLRALKRITNVSGRGAPAAKTIRTRTEGTDGWPNNLQHGDNPSGKNITPHRPIVDYTREDYERKRHEPATVLDSSSNSTLGTRKMPQPPLVYRATEGLGHRLIRMSAIYHTARIHRFSHLNISWGWECGKNDEGNPDIFDHLFGPGPLVVDQSDRMDVDPRFPQESNAPKEYPQMFRIPLNKTNETRIVNYAPGYTYFSNCQRRFQTNHFLVADKARSDAMFYHQLRALFRFRDRVDDFASRHRFSDRLVIGIHVRAGNGETGHFEVKKRGFGADPKNNPSPERREKFLDAWIATMARTLGELVKNLSWVSKPPKSHGTNDISGSKTGSLPPLLFVATDDVSVVQKLTAATNSLGIVTVSYPQQRPGKGSGVSHTMQFSKGEACRESWVSQTMDAMILSEADAVVAGRYSSFTQGLPLAAILAPSMTLPPPWLGKAPPNPLETSQRHISPRTGDSRRLFCESSPRGESLDCYDDYFEWFCSGKPPFARGTMLGEKLVVPYSKEVFVPCWNPRLPDDAEPQYFV